METDTTESKSEENKMNKGKMLSFGELCRDNCLDCSYYQNHECSIEELKNDKV